MIVQIKGILIEKKPSYVVIECNGIGYHVNISLNTYSKIVDLTECKLLTQLIIKEDAHLLFGFVDEEERKTFKLLLNVNGVGATTAIMILSSLTPAEIQNAVMKQDVNTIRNVKGIGPKTAQRLILELSGKIDKILVKDNIISPHKNTTTKNQALSALITLGFSKNDSEKVLDEIIHQSTDIISVEDLIKQALKKV